MSDLPNELHCWSKIGVNWLILVDLIYFVFFSLSSLIYVILYVFFIASVYITENPGIGEFILKNLLSHIYT